MAKSKYGHNPPLVHCADCRFTAPLLESHPGYKWWVILLGLLMMCSGAGIIPAAILFIILGNRTVEVCVNCGSTTIHQTAGYPTEEAIQIWQYAYDDDQKRFDRSKYVLLAIVLSILALVVTLFLVTPRW